MVVVGEWDNHEWRNPVSVASHIHIAREHYEPKNRRSVRNATLKYLKAWHLLADNPLTFPIAVGLYPITVVARTTIIIANRLEQKRNEERS